MIDIKRAIKKLIAQYSYTVKVQQGYETSYFEFDDVEEATAFAQVCLEHSAPEDDDKETKVTIRMQEVKQEPVKEEKKDSEPCDNTEDEKGAEA